MIQNKYVDLSGLPRIGKNNRYIDWKNSVGLSVPFAYDNVCGTIQIVGHDNVKQQNRNYPYLFITIDKYVPTPLKISASILRNALLCNLVGNKIINTDPDMVKFLVNPLDAYTVSYGSGKLIKMMCPYCKTIYDKIPSVVHQYGFSCPVCGDGYSIPNKLMRNILTQLKIDFIPEVSKKHFSWIDKYKYDFYIQVDYKDILIEMDGGYHKWQKDTDNIKDNLAKTNHFKLIRIDCNYSGNPITYIKNNILNSELKNIINLTNIDWDECKNVMIDSEVRRACMLWEEKDYGTAEIANALGRNKHTIVTYLRRGKESGFCPSFTATESIFRGNNPYILILKDDIPLGAFRHVHQLCDRSQELFGEKFNASSVRTCYDKKQTYKGFSIRRITREEYEQHNKMNKNIEVVKEEDIV